MIKLEKIEGVDNLTHLMDELYDLEKNGIVQAILKTNGQRIVDSARNMAPHKTGTLRRAIGFVTKWDRRYLHTVLIGIKHDSKAYQAGRSYPGKYGNILQYDGIKSSRKAVRFMKMALEINRAKVAEGIKKGLEKKIQEAKNKNKL